MQVGNNLYTAIGLLVTLGVMLIGLLATVPAVTAYEKGYRFGKWYVFGVLLLPVAIIAAFRLKPLPATTAR